MFLVRKKCTPGEKMSNFWAILASLYNGMTKRGPRWDNDVEINIRKVIREIRCDGWNMVPSGNLM